MKNCLIFVGIILFVGMLLTSCPTPDTAPELENESESVLYAAGGSMGSAGLLIPGYWRNGMWNSLPAFDVTKEAIAVSILVNEPDLYLAGVCKNSNNVVVPGYWKNGIWVSLPSLEATKESRSFSLALHGTDVYVV